MDWFGPSVKLPGGVGNYARKAGEGLELYGVSDMASILYSLNRLSPSDTERAQWADAAHARWREITEGLPPTR